MNNFDYKDVYMDNGQRVLEINILPEKKCNFDCVCCPLGRKTKVDTIQSFAEIEKPLSELSGVLENNKDKIDLVFINSKGEALLHDKIISIINLVKSKGLAVRLLSNGYLLGKDKYMIIANMCDEIVVTLSVISEEGFQKIHRPINGYTFNEYISNMLSFNKQYAGKFILKVTILKGYNDTEECVSKTKTVIDEIMPDRIIVQGIKYERFERAFGVSEERLNEISKKLVSK